MDRSNRILGSEGGKEWRATRQGASNQWKTPEEELLLFPGYPKVASAKVKAAPSLDTFKNRLDDKILGKS